MEGHIGTTRGRVRIGARVTAGALVAAVAGLSGCHRATAAPAPGSLTNAEMAAIVAARRDSARQRFTDADVRFMTGMIGHHAQAVVVAGWAPSHGANGSVSTLAARIINAQNDEIAIMQRWLRDRGLPVPDAGPATMPMDTSQHMVGMSHATHMPGMLTDAQMAELDSARGGDFDRLFLTYMIQHHRGALVMVKELFAHDGAGQDEVIFRFASDVNVDQTTEIARMERMLFLLNLMNGSS